MIRTSRPCSFDVAVPHQASLGEGPVWIADRSELIWVDIDQAHLHSYFPAADAHESIDLDRQVSSVAPRSAGGLVVTVREGFAALGDAGSRLIAPVEPGDPGTRMNDGACDRAGRYWAGTMCLDGEARAALYRLDPDLGLTRVLSGVSVSNGIAWSPDDKSMYYVDTGTRSVDVFDFDGETGGLAARRALIDVPPAWGKPDGIAVDDDGCIWVALWGGGAVHRYTPGGRLDMRLELPVSQVTGCCFGGGDRATLFVTTAARGVSQDDRLAGALFACRPGVAGPPAFAFAG